MACRVADDNAGKTKKTRLPREGKRQSEEVETFNRGDRGGVGVHLLGGTISVSGKKTAKANGGGNGGAPVLPISSNKDAWVTEKGRAAHVSSDTGCG